LQLEAAAVEKYGGITGMEVERERRRIAAAERSKGGKKTKGSVLRKVRILRTFPSSRCPALFDLL
jgi:hypothetical protein